MTRAPGTSWTFWQDPDPNVLGAESYNWGFLLKVDLVAIIVLLAFFALPPVQAWAACDLRLMAAGFFVHFVYGLGLLAVGFERVNPRAREFLSHFVNLIAVVAIPLSSERPLFALWALYPLIVWMDAYGSPKSVASLLTGAIIPFADPLWHWGSEVAGEKAVMAGISVVIGLVIYLVTSYFTGWSRTNIRQRAELERLRAAEERERALRAERERIGQSLHGTLGAALSEISLWHEIALAGSAPRDAEPLSRAQARAKTALTDLRALVAGLDDERIAAANLCAGIRRQIEGLCAAAGVELVFEEPREGGQDMASAYHVAKVVVEGVTNAVKHAGARRVHVSIALAPLSLTVRDDGVGFDPARVTRGRGLRSLQEHAQALGATLALDSAPGTGTTLAVSATPGGPA